MNDRRDAIREIDLLAYADGLLESDPEQQTAVEAYLRDDPAEGARVRAYAAQNSAIRALYAPVLAEPVPERLHAVLANRPGLAFGSVIRATLAASVLLGAGLIGWWIGSSGTPGLWSAHAFVEQAMTAYGRSHAATPAPPDVAPVEGDQPLHWVLHHLALQLHPPDLTPQGFTLVDKRLLTANDAQTAQMTYAAPDGRRLSLFMRPRGQEQAAQCRFAEKEGVTMAYWLDGPVVYGLVGRLDRQAMMAMTQAIHQSIHQQPQEAASQRQTSVASQPPPLETDIAPVGDALGAPRDLSAPINPVPRETKTN
jgi:anti-sigma factor RsiW